MLLIGQLGMAVGLVASIAAIGAVLWGLSLKPKERVGISKFAFYASYAGAIGFTVSVVILGVAFFTENYSIHYVLANRPTDATGLLWLFRLSGVWAGREGSLLFWTWVLSLFNAYVAYKGLKNPKDLLHAPAIMVLNIVTALFTAVMVFSDVNNPFIATSLEYFVNGKIAGAALSWGMSPILQHWAMIIHPPTLFIGYAGLTVPFAYAMAALIVNDSSDAWVKHVDRITIFSWLFLGAGIGLGAVWAYVVLGWGGYWGWDPVENASILPWFVGVAMIHSFTMYRRRNGFKRWAIMSSAFTFSMVVLGTFITRTGIVQSVHTFGGDPLSLWIFLTIILGAIIAGAIGLWIRWDSFAGNDEMEALSGKEAGYYFNNVLMTVASLIIAYMTISSALPAWLPFGQQSLGPTAYELIARPVGILYLFILAVCPLLSWVKTDSKVLWERIKWPTVFALGLFALLLAEWIINLRPVYADMVAMGGDVANKFLAFGPEIVYDIIAVVGFFVASFVIMNTGALFVRGVRTRMQAKGENVFSAFGAVLLKARSQSGGYISHIAMGIIVIGLIGSGMYVRDISTNMPDVVGQEISVSNYKFVYQGKEEVLRDNGDAQLSVKFDVVKNGKKIGDVHPSMTSFKAMGQNRLNAVVLSEPLRDIFMVFQGQSGDQLSVNVKINPLIWLVWSGFIMLLAGTALASWPRKKVAA